MTQHLSKRILAVAACLLLSCGGSSTGGEDALGPGPDATDPAADGRVELHELCDVFLTDVCTALMQCAGWAYEDMAHCQADRECLGMADLEAEAEAGWIDYDPAAVAACHDLFAATPCDSFFLFVPSVQEVLLACPERPTGNQGVGDPCVSLLDCEAGTYCSMQGYSCPGRCQAWLMQGDSCDPAAGLRCDPSLECRDGSCEVEPPRGQDGDLCDATAPCAEDFWCDFDTSRCNPDGDIGDPCDWDPACQDGLWCQSAPLATGTCAQPSTDGGPCLFDSHCQGDLVCFVDYPLGVCGAPAQRGGACLGNDECADGLFCENDTDTCQPRLGVGAYCRLHSDCAEGLQCDEGACAHERYPGDACSDGTSVCILSTCDGDVCRYRAGLGEACSQNGECASRTCDGDVCVDGELCFPD